ncbi:hypothetical protein MM221_10650 [Salipaludibacillus sp. LMS25]|jgi:hypothetical protein|uniref:hypothetical protein n=1 Tax=Salipaludibacillus sp. LMS25 TaxID=2924031 RepID=UPI0020D00590|nr:hypothetical protein [Salipaludibacillus sp. LMS25]UTR13119.1 hypothetical protein MM221_10650 [Salipaludibacillus sp. LMS25]
METYFIAIVIVVMQFFLSRSRLVFLGGVLPTLFLLAVIYGWFTNFQGLRNDILSFAIISIGGITWLLSFWVSGREAFKKKLSKELEKIELHDLK